MKYFISCEGKTERWYLEWLQSKINSDNRAEQKVEFVFKNVMPSSFAKSNNSTFTKEMISDSIFCRIQDIEDYSDFHLKKFHELLESTKKAKLLFKKYKFLIGYSNFTFEVWMIAHKAQVKTITDRSQYYKQINNAYGTDFADNDDFKHEKNFASVLKTLSLDDVLYKALPECERFKSFNRENSAKLQRSKFGFDYILNNPDTTLDDFIKSVLQDAGII